MKRILVITALASIMVGVLASSASAHSSTLIGTAVCQEATGTYLVSWVSTTTNNDSSPKIGESDNASLPVGASLPATFQQTVPGDSTSVSANIRIYWTDGFKARASATVKLPGTCKAPPPPPSCPPNLTFVSFDGKVLVCKETITTPGPPSPPVTVYVDKPGPPVEVIKFKDKIVYRYRNKVVIRYKNHRVVVTKIRYVPCAPSQIFNPTTRRCVPRPVTG